MAGLVLELTALGAAASQHMGDALARRYVRGAWAVSAADAAAALLRRRFLSALPACQGALRLAAYEWAADELGDQACSRLLDLGWVPGKETVCLQRQRFLRARPACQGGCGWLPASGRPTS